MPTSLIALAIFLFALVPGWLFTQVRFRFQRTERRGDLHELAEAVATGTAATAVASLLLLLAEHFFDAPLPLIGNLLRVDNLGALTDEQLREYSWLGLGLLVLSIIVAGAASFLLYGWGKSAIGSESIWHGAFDTVPRQHWATNKLKPGLLTLTITYAQAHLPKVRGNLDSYSSSTTASGDRDLILSGLLEYFDESSDAWVEHPTAQHSIINASDIALIEIEIGDDGPAT